MFETVYCQLEKWALDTLKNIVVSPFPPFENSKEQTVHIYLKEIDKSDLSGLSVTVVKQLALVFWISITGPNLHKNNKDIIDLIFSLMDCPGFEMEFGKVSASDWVAFNTKPNPSFYVRYSISQPHHNENETSLVEEALVIKSRQK